MIEKEIVIQDPIGIHARPAALLVQTLKEFKSDFSLIKGDKKLLQRASFKLCPSEQNKATH